MARIELAGAVLLCPREEVGCGAVRKTVIRCAPDPPATENGAERSPAGDPCRTLSQYLAGCRSESAMMSSAEPSCRVRLGSTSPVARPGSTKLRISSNEPIRRAARLRLSGDAVEPVEHAFQAFFARLSHIDG
jgi:hypothetical protein